MLNKTILIVEDEADIADAIAESLREAEFTVLMAENGSQGMAIALSEQPDLILLDLKMPIMDGHQFLDKLRDDPWGSNARVVVLTAMDDVNNVATAHESKIKDYIIKSHLSLDEVVKKVREALVS
ncbi:response regulator [Candidatus Kaiserbacteria bacterium]|nr:response regulator [Candidatus Kaiserbacteria bacterium]